VCIGLTEIMASTSKDNILAFSDSLVPTVRKALMDPLPDVRSSAAKTFDNLHNMIGSKALEEVGISLLEEMKKGRFALPFTHSISALFNRSSTNEIKNNKLNYLSI
jgi:hypothetical protein